MSVSLLDVSGPIATVLDRLPGHRRSGHGWVARCPAHDDRHESLSVGMGRDGRVLLKCHAGCDAKDIVAELGIAWTDLFPDPPAARTARGGRIVAEYDYVDAEGTLLYQAVRKEPKAFLQRQPDGHGGWTWNLKGVERVLYRLPALLQAIAAGRTVFVVEGEKDVHTLEAHGFIATTQAGGAGKWQDSFSRVLAGARVVLVPDNDPPGQQHMAEVAASLVPLAAEVREVRLPGLPPKGDVSDWFGDGHTRDELKALVRDAAAIRTVVSPPAVRRAPPTPPDPAEASPPPDAPDETDTTAPPPDRLFKCTDLGNAERLVAAFGEDLRYVAQLKRWYRWDGRRWARDLTRQVEQLAKAVVRQIPAEAALASSDQIRSAIESWARKSEARGRIVAMLAGAESEPRLALEHAALDAEPWLLAVENGVLDLRTGELRPHRREDLITMVMPIAYDGEATCPGWQRFLTRILAGNTDLIGFLQRAIGYSLTGITREQVLFFLHGTGANGKSTFLEILRALVGDYATQADFATFLERRGDGPRNDVARLVGARVVTSSEVGEGKRLDEGLVKSLTGSDTIAARLLYSEAFEFRPQFKLWLAANHKPVIRGTDHAIWRRVRLIPFTVEIPEAERDPDLVPKLRKELPGILAWAVQGCLDWQEYGLSAPEAVLDATDDYRRESDVLGVFLETRCELGQDFSASASQLYQAYREWAQASGEFVLSQTSFGRRLTERGILPIKAGSGGTAHRKGLRLVPDETPGIGSTPRYEPATTRQEEEGFL